MKHGQFIVIIWDGLWQKDSKSPFNIESDAVNRRDELIASGKKPNDVRITRIQDK